jgi:hypothetical protein
MLQEPEAGPRATGEDFASQCLVEINHPTCIERYPLANDKASIPLHERGVSSRNVAAR